MKKLLCGLLLGLSLSGVALAAIDTYEFKDEGERQRFRELTEELRCPKCQNQNIADSNAPIAMDLRREIYRMFAEGKSNAEIVEFLVDRYGDFVLYNPPLSSKTLLLWYGPLPMLGCLPTTTVGTVALYLAGVLTIYSMVYYLQVAARQFREE